MKESDESNSISFNDDGTRIASIFNENVEFMDRTIYRKLTSQDTKMTSAYWFRVGQISCFAVRSL